MEFCLLPKDKKTLLELLEEEGLENAADFLKAEVPECTRKPSRFRRAPSAYNLFIKDCIAEAKEKGEKRSLAECAVDWKTEKLKK